MVRARSAEARFPMAVIFPLRIPTSPEYQGEPVPSMMRPLVMTMSKVEVWATAAGRNSNKGRSARIVDFHRRNAHGTMMSLQIVAYCCQQKSFYHRASRLSTARWMGQLGRRKFPPPALAAALGLLEEFLRLAPKASGTQAIPDDN